MGRYTQGILGSFTGKVGAVIGSSWKGIHYMRGLAKRTTKTPTEGQLAQRARFSLAVEFLKPARQLVDMGFMNTASNQTGYHVALAKMLGGNRPAVTGTYPWLSVDYPKVRLSEGPLAPAENVALTAGDTGQVVIGWSMAEGNALSDPADRAMVLLFEPTQARYVVNTAGALRSELSQTFTVAGYAGKEVHAWIAFISADGNTVSGSVYAGKLTVA